MMLLANGLALFVVWWCVCRATHMDEDTNDLDRISLTMLTGGAVGYLIRPWFQEPWVDVLFWAGIAGWTILPTIRKRSEHAQQPKA